MYISTITMYISILTMNISITHSPFRAQWAARILRNGVQGCHNCTPMRRKRAAHCAQYVHCVGGPCAGTRPVVPAPWGWASYTTSPRLQVPPLPPPLLPPCSPPPPHLWPCRELLGTRPHNAAHVACLCDGFGAQQEPTATSQGGPDPAKVS